MNCFRPISIDNPHGSGKISVPCGKCEACLQNDCNEWYVRLIEEEKSHDVPAIFFTLTYDDTYLPVSDAGIAVVCKRDVQLFLKRFRKNAISRFRYFICSEYGPTNGRPHYHGVFFGYVGDLRSFEKALDRSWQKGFCTSSYCNRNRLRYLVSYVTTKVYIPPCLRGIRSYRPFRLVSQGLGRSYFSEHNRHYHKQSLITYYQDGKFRYKLPRYFSRKIFSDEERERIREKNLEFLRTQEQQRKQRFADEYYNQRLSEFSDFTRERDFIRKVTQRQKKRKSF